MDYAEVKRLLADKLRQDTALKAAVAEQIGGAIAVIGMHGRFPGTATPGAYFDALLEHRRQLAVAGRSRWTAAASQAVAALAIGRIDGALEFDHKLFRMSPREAEAMDPHHRVMLESVAAAIEDAGYAAGDLAGSRTAVFVAMYNQDFAHVSRSPAWQRESQIYLGTGGAHSLLPNRISYLFDLQGPSEIVDTACSSAVVALHRAVQAIRADECDQAIVGGVSLLLDPERLAALHRIGVLSPDGRCALFDRASSGQIMGEGVAAVVLKREARAVADRDHIYAVIRGSGVNHRGRRSGGLTRPDVESQVALIDEVYRRAELAPADVAYVEAHGNGGAGDVVELRAFQRRFAAGTPIGSAKANIGCLEAAGGLAQLIKVAMAIDRGVMPATLDHHALPDHPELRPGATPVLTENRSIDQLRRRPGAPFIAAIHAYGLGGVNAHVVVQEPAAAAERRAAVDAVPLVVSGRTDDAVRELAHQLGRALAAGPPPRLRLRLRLDDVGFTLAVGRPHHAHRRAVFARTLDEARAGLDRVASGASGELVERDAPDGLHADVQRWLAGAQVDWRPYLPDARRVSLPGSPLVRTTYALPGLDPAAVLAPPVVTGGAVEDVLRAWLAAQCGVAAGDLDDRTALAEYGVDSVVHVELCAQIERVLGVALSPLDLGPGATIAELAGRIGARGGDAPVAAFAERELAVPASLTERERLFQHQLGALRAQLVPPASPALRAALEPCRDRFDVWQDARGDLWVFVHTDAGNTFDLAGLRGLRDVAIAARDHADFERTAAIYLAHTGPSFSLGGDRRAFVDAVRAGDRGYLVEVGATYKQFLAVVQALPCVTVGVAYGSAQGGGMELLMALDHQVVWPRVKLGFPEIRSGLIAGMGGVSYVASIVGPQRALALNLGGALIASEQAHALGLISEVSARPFDAALAFGATSRGPAARRVRDLVNRRKYPLLVADVDAWVELVCDGSVLDREHEIRDDFALIGRGG
jgi:polyketide synthase PksN